MGEVLAGVAAGQQPGEDELTALFAARGPEVRAVAEVADDLRRQAVGDVVTFVRNRNINYTNVCTFRCRFCAFSKGPASLNLRGAPYLLGLDEVARRVVEADERGATEVTLQGGIHPSFDGDYYLHVAEAVHEAVPACTSTASPPSRSTRARRLGEPLRDYLLRLRAAGLASLPGTAAEILDDEVRAVICPDKVTTEEWLEVHRVAHSVGLRSNITIMFGHVESPRHWARHLVRTRDLQAETGGFTEFVPLPFVHMAAPMYRKRQSRPGPTFREAVLIHAVGRIAYRGLIDNIQVSWVKMGADGVRQALLAGVNDLGGTLMDENISRAAGPPRPAHGGGRVPGHRRAPRPPPGAAHHPLRPHPHRGPLTVSRRCRRSPSARPRPSARLASRPRCRRPPRLGPGVLADDLGDRLLGGAEPLPLLADQNPDGEGGDHEGQHQGRVQRRAGRGPPRSRGGLVSEAMRLRNSRVRLGSAWSMPRNRSAQAAMAAAASTRKSGMSIGWSSAVEGDLSAPPERTRVRM